MLDPGCWISFDFADCERDSGLGVHFAAPVKVDFLLQYSFVLQLAGFFKLLAVNALRNRGWRNSRFILRFTKRSNRTGGNGVNGEILSSVFSVCSCSVFGAGGFCAQAERARSFVR
jgi:hypothetical protein